MPLTYAGFLAAFVAGPIAGLAAVAPARSRPGVVRVLPAAVIVGIAMAYTVPWDNHLIAMGVWSYDPSLVAARLWWAPVEEYAFIALQPVLAAVWLDCVVPGARVDIAWRPRDAALGLLAAALIGLAGALALTTPGTFYLGAIVTWAAPVLGLQWAVGWRPLLARGRAVAIGVAGPTLYLAAADAVAIDHGIWRLSPEYTTGLTVLGLPVEEGAFFLVTTLLVVQGLLLYPWVIGRCR
jgi:lycopene cyclase domain-containing protein